MKEEVIERGGVERLGRVREGGREGGRERKEGWRD